MVMPEGKRFQPGVSGNPGGRSKEDAELKRVIAEKCPPEYFVKKLLDFVEFADTHSVKLNALIVLLERLYGKPKQAVEHSGEIVTWGSVIEAIKAKSAAG